MASHRERPKYAVVREIARVSRGSTAGVRLTSGVVGSIAAATLLLSDRLAAHRVLSPAVAHPAFGVATAAVLFASVALYLYLRLSESRLARLAARFMSDDVLVEQFLAFHDDRERWEVLPGIEAQCFRRCSLARFVHAHLVEAMGGLRFGMADQCAVAADRLTDEVLAFLEREGAVAEVDRPTFERIYRLEQEAFRYVV